MFKKMIYIFLISFFILSISAVSAESDILDDTTLGTTLDSTTDADFDTAMDTSTTPNNHSYSIKYFDKSVGGNVLKNSKISKNMPKSTLSQKIVSMAKKGSVILKFGNGKGKKIVLCAGIHGNENAANIAALKFIETIKNKKIKGTIYVIPFIIPKDTAINNRTYHSPQKGYVDPNRISNVPGSPGYKIIQFAKKNNIKFLIDIHTGGDLANHKNGHVFANKKPTSIEETKWLKYIEKNMKPSIKKDTAPKGYIRGYSKANNINVVTFEVERDKGSVSHWANVEYKMLINACKYFKLFK